MRRLLALLSVCGLLSAGCSDGTTIETYDVTPEDSVHMSEQDTQSFACSTPAECMGKVTPGACEEIVCNEGLCGLNTLSNATPCDDGNGCTVNDVCLQGECSGTARVCADDNACTSDSCDETTGECVFANNTDACNDNYPCTQGEACLNGLCQGGENLCECVEDADCAKYDDGDLCNGSQKCTDGSCAIDPTTIKTCSTEGLPACKLAYCDPDDAQCKQKNIENGTACDSGDKCTKNTVCLGGVCGNGQAVDCNDNNSCTADSCTPATGCVHTPEVDGTGCTDKDLCTQNDQCIDGLCVGEPIAACSGCTTDIDCQPFEDGNLCNGTLYCYQGKCEVNPATVVPCAASTDTCKQVTCQPTTGNCVTQDALGGTPCNDNNACTKGDYCAQGNCVGLPLDCDDQNACTENDCDPLVGCVNTPKDAPCGDGNPCTTDDHCEDGVCVGTLDPSCQCTTKADCAPFEDGDLCNGTLICVNNQCVVDESTVKNCTQGLLNPCVTAVCEALTGACIEQDLSDGSSCNDHNACTENDKCLGLQCSGSSVQCDDGNLCTSEVCHAELGCVYEYNSLPCNDNNDCTKNDTCQEGICLGEPDPICECDTADDCVEFEDGNLCNGTLICVSHKCIVDPDSVVSCNTSGDSDCRVTYCVPPTGECLQSQYGDGKPCNDKNKCTLSDACQAGVCTGTGAPVCQDNNPCTTDACNPDLGCTYIPNSDPCEDGDPCTGGDLCTDGVCQPGSEDLCGNSSCLPDWTLTCGDTDSWGNLYPGATDLVDNYACTFWDYTAPEYTYTFTAPYDATVRVSLTDESADTDIQVLASAGEGCDPDQCLASDFSSVEIAVTQGSTYFLVVDGYEDGVLGGEGTWDIRITCTPDHELDCSDGVDDDGDGLVDCEDEEDCLGTEDCPLALCAPAWTLYCAEPDTWRNYWPGSTDQIDGYACNSYNYSGPEYAYSFVAPTSGTYSVTLSDESAETDLLLLEAGEGNCDPMNCLDWDFDTLTFDALEGATYYFVVDGYFGAEGDYTIEVTCP